MSKTARKAGADLESTSSQPQSRPLTVVVALGSVRVPMEGESMSKSTTAGHPGSSPILDRVFAGSCTAVFLMLVGGVVDAVYMYWR